LFIGRVRVGHWLVKLPRCNVAFLKEAAQASAKFLRVGFAATRFQDVQQARKQRLVRRNLRWGDAKRLDTLGRALNYLE
jgi:hypothetical protein